MNSNICVVSLLIKGKPITEYQSNGQTFVEGRGGSDFEIAIRNKSDKRIMVVVSVDGVSVINGGPAGPDSPGYAINPLQEIKIPGWKLTNDQAAKFTFGSRKNSYAQSASGSEANCGVVGVMVWSEKELNAYDFKIDPLTQTNGSFGHPIGGVFPQSDTTRATERRISSTTDYSAQTVAKVALASGATSNNLGTKFGQATNFNTKLTSFNKHEVIDRLVVYYDDSVGLKARGIVLERPVQNRVTIAPDPFPAMGCTPPKGWKK